MKNKLNKELIVQISIILVCLAALAFQFTSEPLQAQQISCNGQPPLKPNPRTQAWSPGIEGVLKQISVVVFDHSGQNEQQNQSDFETINTGIQLWNTHSTTNCSNIRFKDAVRAGREYIPGENIPDNTVYVIRPSNTQMVPVYQNPGLPTQYIRAVMLRFQFPFQTNTPGEFRRLIAHELGHSFALLEEDMPRLRDRSIMGHAFTVTDCDVEAVRKVYCPIDGCFVPLNESLSTEESSRDSSQRPIDPHECGPYYEWNPTTCECDIYTPPSSPVLIDTLGNGFNLTNNLNGVRFDLNNDGRREQLSWTSAGSDDAWLALDRNSNGTVDGGKELFGNFTPQPAPPLGEERNGFLALAEYDKPSQGGNNDGEISQQDLIFTRLRLWRDTNHNGISETNELHQFNDSGLRKIELDYRESRKTDEFGNQFKYRAKVKDAQDAQMNRWAWDVFLVTEP